MAVTLAGYEALHEGAALIDLTGRGHIRATGEDRARLLHAMTTNHIQQLKPGECAYAFFLTAQGRIIADVNVLCTDDALLLDTEPAYRATVYQHLDKFIIADDVTLEDETDAMCVFGLEGPRARHYLEQLGAAATPEANQWVAWRSNVTAAISATGAEGYRLFAPAALRDEIHEWINGLGVPMATEEEWNTVRVENARPRYGADITDRQIPQETQIMRALHFSKGCYLGQEIVERVRSRGHVNRKLVQMEIDGDADQVTKQLTVDGREVGETTSAVWSPKRGRIVALGYVRTEVITNRSELRCGALPVRITDRTPA